MASFRVTVEYSVSQSLEVDADTIDEAIQEALGGVDTPNGSNQFDQAGDPHIAAIYDESGESLPVPEDYE
ncbi:hypothetical protein [Mycobacteroides abscessus]|uniref:hypothetical protein n=1 Tax=Mycobacteroides abscessus TaxID=36809 RepID=UPI000C26800A|nr:hypothetical protein [Mycobacteroides abscessus]